MMNAAAVRYLRAFIRHPTAKWAPVPAAVKFLKPQNLYLSKDEAQEVLFTGVDLAINTRGGLDMQIRNKNHFKYCWDQRRVEEFMVQRIKATGCRNLLRTTKMRSRYPEVNNQIKGE